MNNDVKGREHALAGLQIYLDYLMRSEVNKLLKENPERQDYSEELASRVGQRIVNDYKQYGPVIMRDLGKEIRRRINRGSTKANN